MTGLKPTWGRVSVNGAFELAASLDHIGPMCRSAADCGAMLGLMAGADPRDPSARVEPVPDYLAGNPHRLRDLHDLHDLHDLCIGIDPAYNSAGVDAAMRAAVDDAADVLRALGAELRHVVFPDPIDAIRDWPATCAVKTAVAHEATFPAQRAAYGPGLAGVIDMGRTMSSLDLQKVWLRRRAFAGRINALFETIDLLLIPAQPMDAPTNAEMSTLGTDPASFARRVKFSAPFNMSESPTITLPSGFTRDSAPVAIQLVARHVAEATLVRAGWAFQREAHWHRRHPAGWR